MAATRLVMRVWQVANGVIPVVDDRLANQATTC
jgi:hypothetical protein